MKGSINNQNQIEKTDGKLKSRRCFLGDLGKAAIATAVISMVENAALANSPLSEKVKVTKMSRRAKARAIRIEAANFHYNRTPENLVHQNNGDETLYPNKIANFSKGLPHQSNGEVVPSAYKMLSAAIDSGEPDKFEEIPMGGKRRLINPQAGYSFGLEGGDPQCYEMKPPPAFASREQAAEIAENYWMAVLRDVNFLDYEDSSIARDAAADLNRFGADYKGAKDENGLVNTKNLFRGKIPGAEIGPYMSQFWYLPTRFGANWINTRIRTVLSLTDGGRDYLTDFDSWLSIQTGGRWAESAYDPVLRWMRNGRDLGEWTHVDVLFQGYFQSLLVLLGNGILADKNNPYNFSRTQDGFGTLGAPYISSLVCQVAQNALRSVWFQKWCVHRRMRPEVFGGRIHQVLKNKASYPIHTEVLDSLASDDRLGKYLTEKNGLLPIAFPEGSPTHPSYGAGHATVAGACVTILKAFFDEDKFIPGPLVPNSKGTVLSPYIEHDATKLTVGGELNKIAANVAIGRNIAGVHWLSDATESLKLGEQIAIDLLRDQKTCFNEKFDGFELTKFDGTKINI
jgi:membrane-associated phospholipid phosphatase